MIVNVVEEKWDILIILDACRYDFFEENYRDYFSSGKLELRQTIGTSTVEWRDKSFKENYQDIVYISANPNISNETSVHNFIGKEHFYKVYEIWNSHWDKYRGTVLPEIMTNVSLDIISKHPDKRFILHYMQPHEPYLMPSIVSCGYDKADINSNRKLIGYKYNSKLYNVRLKLLKTLMKHSRFLHKFTNRPEWFIRQLLFLPPRCAMDAVRRRYGKKKLRQAYKNNLKYAFE